MGGEEYAKIGSERNGGTRLFGISGHVERPGVYELPMGYNLKKAIYDVAGGIKDGKKLKAVVRSIRSSSAGRGCPAASSSVSHRDILVCYRNIPGSGCAKPRETA